MATDVGRCLAARATRAPHRAQFHGLGHSAGIAIAGLVMAVVVARYPAMQRELAEMRSCQASAIEAQRATTPQSGVVEDESAAPQEDAQTQSDEGMQ